MDEREVVSTWMDGEAMNGGERRRRLETPRRTARVVSLHLRNNTTMTAHSFCQI